jgi:hypothetical protein
MPVMIESGEDKSTEVCRPVCMAAHDIMLHSVQDQSRLKLVLGMECAHYWFLDKEAFIKEIQTKEQRNKL